MSIQITHVRFGSANNTEDEIVRYQYTDLGTGLVDQSDKPSLVARVDWGLVAYVDRGINRVNVVAVHPTRGEPYLQTISDGRPTNNLVNLPTF